MMRNKPKSKKNMNSYADSKQKNKSQSLANESSQKKSNSESSFQFVDNRPEAVAQRKLQNMANNSMQIAQLKGFQDMANNSNEVVQRIGWDDLLEAGTAIADQLLGERTAEAVVHAVNPNNALSLGERASLILAATANATMANLSTVMGALGADPQLTNLIENAEEAIDID
jgi:hypothetical protein